MSSILDPVLMVAVLHHTRASSTYTYVYVVSISYSLRYQTSINSTELMYAQMKNYLMAAHNKF